MSAEPLVCLVGSVLHILSVFCGVLLCFVCLRPVSCVPPVLPVSLDCRFLIAPLVFSKVYCQLGIVLL